MRNFILLVILFFASSVAHWGLASLFASFNIGVSFMFTVSMMVAMIYPKWSGYTFAFFGGLFLDFFGVNMFGAYALTFTLCVGIIYFLKRKMDFEVVLPQVVLIFLLSIASILIYNLAGIVFLKGIAWHGFKSLFLGSLINAVVSPPVFYVLIVLRALSVTDRKN
ncbi:rod shape-determining protein MreD [Elusimicrobium posterum]|uniref:rod shape-determining protein MreD n=1 Tax=Elusimicrobium posterum TaxID=3116653 RepID=UPI003C793DB7